MKLIMESWKRFLNEQEGQEAPNVSAGGVTAAQLYRLSLPDFVKALNSNREDIIRAVLSGTKDGSMSDDAISIEPGTVKCSDLRPTQSEVVFSKSIPFALGRPELFMEYFKSDGPFKVGPPGNDAIITLNGKYILDGHHRWSSLYCVNPNAEMYTFDIKMPVSPINALKLMQASIKAYVGGQIPSNKGGGTNLFTIDRQTLNKEVNALVTPQIAEQYVQLGLIDIEGRQDVRGEVANRLFGIYDRNVKQMQARNKPVSGASSREPMPQTDAPEGSNVSAGGATPAALEPLEKGQVDFRSPFSTDK